MSVFQDDDDSIVIPKFSKEQQWLLGNQRSATARYKLERYLLILGATRKREEQFSRSLKVKEPWSTLVLRWWVLDEKLGYPWNTRVLYSLDFCDIVVANEVMNWLERREWDNWGWLQEEKWRWPTTEHALFLHAGEATELRLRFSQTDGVTFGERGKDNPL